MNLMQQGAALIAQTLKSSASEDVTLSAGPHSTPDIKAAIGRTDSALFVAAGNQVTLASRYVDFLIEQADYKLNGSVVEPRANHRLTRENGMAYEVAAIGNAEPCWRFASAHGTLLRIHAVEVRR